MSEKDKKKQIVKISVFITSIFVIFLSITYAFINLTLTGDKKQVITVGNLELELDEDDAITIENAFPMYDEVGIIQEDAFNFHLVNKGKNAASYILSLKDITKEDVEKLDLSIVRYGFIKGKETPQIDTIESLRRNAYILDEGTIPGKTTNDYSLRLWIDKDITDDNIIKNKSLSYKIEVKAGQNIALATYTVTFDTDGGSTEESIEVTENKSYGSLPTPTKKGHTFNGWYNGNELITDASIVPSGGDITLQAHWNRNSYTLTVNPNEGTWKDLTAEQRMILEYEQEKAIEDPTRVGYTFQEWVIKGEDSSIKDRVFKMGSEDASLTAKWKINTYTLTVDPNGGTWKESNSKTPIELEYLKSTDIPNPKREGYTFTGWEKTGEGNLESTTFTIGPGDATLKAKWEVNNYPWIVYHNKQNIGGNGYTLVEADTDQGEKAFGTQITPDLKSYTGFTAPGKQTLTIQVDSTPPQKNVVNYNYTRDKHNLIVKPNGGSYNNTTNDTTYSMYYEETKTIANPTKTGHSFTGWSGGTLANNVFTMETSDVTLTAGWQANNYVVTFDASGGSVNTSTLTVTYGSTYKSLPTPTKTGYKFLGWYTGANGTGSKIENSTTVTITSAQTLYAGWEANTYTVTFNADGGSVTPSTLTVTYGSTYQSLPTPTKTGYKFLGWYTETGGSGNKIENNTSVTITGPQTLYANWEANKYVVTFDPNDGKISSGPSTLTVTYNSTYGTLPHARKSLSHYSFAGWFTSATGGTKIEDTTTVSITQNQTLYAHYDNIIYSNSSSRNEFSNEWSWTASQTRLKTGESIVGSPGTGRKIYGQYFSATFDPGSFKFTLSVSTAVEILFDLWSGLFSTNGYSYIYIATDSRLDLFTKSFYMTSAVYSGDSISSFTEMDNKSLYKASLSTNYKQVSLFMRMRLTSGANGNIVPLLIILSNENYTEATEVQRSFSNY